MMKRIVALTGFLGAWFAIAQVAVAQDRDVKIVGRVVDAAGKPVAGVEVAPHWGVPREGGKQSGLGAAKTDADGKFVVKVNFDGKDVGIMAIDSERKTGGLAIVARKAVMEPVEIRLGPVVRVHGKFDSKALGRPPIWMYVYVNLLPGKMYMNLAQIPSHNAEFSVFLPVGKYEFYMYGGDVNDIKKVVETRADQPDLDLGTIDLAATVLAKHKGKTPPPWTIADARGVPKTVSLDDYKGKWVLIDFWGYWCGPCVLQLGEMIDFYEDHSADLDKFEIIAFHDGTVKDFAEMDAKTEHTRKTLWQGRSLPFPIVLDAQSGEHGATVGRYEIKTFPTSLLIDPTGKLVGEATLEALETFLPKVPLARRILRAMDRVVAIGVNGGPLDKNLKYFSEAARIPIKIDEDALKAAGIDPSTVVTLEMGGGVSLRSWLELLLDPLGLIAVPGDEAIMITRPKDGAAPRQPSKGQALSNAAIEEKLRVQKVTFDFKDVTLAQVAAHFEGVTRENFVLDPAGRKSGAIDPEAVVSGSAKDVPLREAVEAMLKPLGLVLVVQDEVVILKKAAR